eukprot:UN24890
MSQVVIPSAALPATAKLLDQHNQAKINQQFLA